MKSNSVNHENAASDRDLKDSSVSGRGRWLSNVDDPRKQRLAFGNPDEQRECEQWISGHIIGPPKATEAYSVEQLEAMGLIGIYAKPDEELVNA